MKKLLKTTALTLLLAGTITLFSTGEVKAALQSNVNKQYTKAAGIETWPKLFRQMEQQGEALGLNETFDGTTLLATSESNNLDSHMIKTTEYGAIAILSASGYGNPKNDKAITSTTDNNTGMMLNTSNGEWVAGGIESGGTAFSKIDARYYNGYGAVKRGDGLGKTTDTNPGTRGWHSASKSGWLVTGNYNFVRGNGGIFSFSCEFANDKYFARGVIVCGEGL